MMNTTIFQRFKQAHAQQLTTEIAHKVLQPLTATTNYINGSLHYLKEANVSQDIVHALEQAIQQIKRSSDIMSIFRQDLNTGKHLLIDIEQLVRQVLSALDNDIKQLGISIVFIAFKDLPKIYGNQAQIEYILLLLITNMITLMSAADISKKELTIDINSHNRQLSIEIYANNLVINNTILTQLDSKLIRNITLSHKGKLNVNTEKITITLSMEMEKNHDGTGDCIFSG